MFVVEIGSACSKISTVSIVQERNKTVGAKTQIESVVLPAEWKAYRGDKNKNPSMEKIPLKGREQMGELEIYNAVAV